jgi:hypothetical protein
MLIVNNKGLSQKSLVLNCLLILAISGMTLFSGISINLNNNQAQAQEDQQQQKGQTNGKPDQKDQNRFISKVSPSNGSIIELNWVKGLNAPKGV